MDRHEAEQVLGTLLGWRDARIEEDEYGCSIVATEPLTGRRMLYSPSTGYFEAIGYDIGLSPSSGEPRPTGA